MKLYYQTGMFISLEQIYTYYNFNKDSIDKYKSIELNLIF